MVRRETAALLLAFVALLGVFAAAQPFFAWLDGKGHKLCGFVAVVGSIAFFGSFGVPIKSKTITDAQVDPMVFQMYYSTAIFVSGSLVLIKESFVWTAWGIAGAGLWVPSSLMVIFAINNAGLAVAQGTWSGVTIVVSFIWGAAYFHDDVKSIIGSVGALALLCTGIAVLASSNTDAFRSLMQRCGFSVGVTATKSTSIQCSSEDNEDSTATPTSTTLAHDGDGDAHVASEPLLHADHVACMEEGGSADVAGRGQGATGGMRRMLMGLTASVVLGTMNGSMLMPLRLAPTRAQGIVYTVSFSIGVPIVTLGLALVYFGAYKRAAPVWQWRIALLPGLVTGMLWSLGNYCSIWATLGLGLTVGFPLTQLALLVAGFWGLLAFREFKARVSIGAFFVGAVVLLAGAALLSVYG